MHYGLNQGHENRGMSAPVILPGPILIYFERNNAKNSLVPTKKTGRR